jgi:hypothetical protein
MSKLALIAAIIAMIFVDRVYAADLRFTHRDAESKRVVVFGNEFFEANGGDADRLHFIAFERRSDPSYVNPSAWTSLRVVAADILKNPDRTNYSDKRPAIFRWLGSRVRLFFFKAFPLKRAAEI